MDSFRQYLLTEMPMKTEGDLPEGVYVTLRAEAKWFMLFYSNENRELLRVDGDTFTTEPTGQFFGSIKTVKDDQGFWAVEGVSAMHGWGPLLYDLAIEYATLRGGGLVSDRKSSVSTHAHDVWEKYAWERPDVDNKILDPSLRRFGPYSPADRVYTKKPDRLKALKAAGKLLEVPSTKKKSNG